MISLKHIRENSDSIKKSLIKKNSDIDLDELLFLDEKHRQCLKKVEKLRANKNITSNKISIMIKNGEDATAEIK